LGREAIELASPPALSRGQVEFVEVILFRFACLDQLTLSAALFGESWHRRVSEPERDWPISLGAQL